MKETQTTENKVEAEEEVTVPQEPEAEAQPVPEPQGGVKVYPDKVLTKKEQQKRTAFRWIILNVGIIMMSVSVYFFQAPNNFATGGVAGLSIMLSEVITPSVPWLKQAVIMAIINVALLIVGLIVLGKQCTFRTIYCSLVYTGLIWVFETLVPLGKPLTAHYIFDEAGEIIGYTGTQTFLELCYAILLFGVGGAMIFNCNASSGGTDIIALILKKFTKINVGVALLIIDVLVATISVYTFKSLDIALYSFLGLFARTFLLDGVIESFGKTKYITIITSHPEVISDYILNVIQHGYTMYDAEGGYSHEQKKVLITVCKRGEALKLKTKVKEVDPTAFVIITDANEILGKGFGGTF
ncbi:MAG: YitT family protein [Clostridia bacterium]|nr:YitT family protein [Clostridia bacterium]